MNRSQFLLLISGVVLFAALYFGGKTNQKKTPVNSVKPAAAAFDVKTILVEAKKSLNTYQNSFINNLESQIENSANADEKLSATNQLVTFWHDSLHNHELYVFYLFQAAQLVNSEKSLTFAARQILQEMREERNPPLRIWKADRAIELFEKAVSINPVNDSLKIDMASARIIGKGMAGDAQETMAGVQQLLQIVRKDSSNMYAQLTLGIGGVLSSQYDKAIPRLELVIRNQPKNLEAVSWLADCYAAKNDRENAIKWYNYSKKLVNDPAFSKEVDERIKLLK